MVTIITVLGELTLRVLRPYTGNSLRAEVAELADAQVSEACAERRGGSTPPLRIYLEEVSAGKT